MDRRTVRDVPAWANLRRLEDVVTCLDVEDLLDADCWQGGNSASAGLFFGAPRTVRVSLTADF